MITATEAAMTTAKMVPVELYLNTSYRPDCDYVDGEVLERNLGEQPHASVQKFFIGIFLRHENEWGVTVFPEQRVQISRTRYRVADVCVVLQATGFEPIVPTPPPLCIEVVSKDDRMSEMQERVHDYIRMGVTAVWVVDPKRRRSFFADRSETLQLAEEMLTVYGTEIRVPTAEIFRELDKLEGVSR
jgi:Uma2 family endonuclease